MQTTSALYKQILADPEHVKEWRVTIGSDVYDKTNTVSIRRSSALYGKQLIGGACSGSLELVLLFPTSLYRWKKYAKRTVYRWAKYAADVSRTYEPEYVSTTGSVRYGSSNRTRVLQSVPSIVVEGGAPAFDFSAGTRTTVSTSNTPIGSICAGDANGIKTSSSDFTTASHYAVVKAVSSSFVGVYATAELYRIKTTETHSRGEFIGNVESENADAYPQDGYDAATDAWYTLVGQETERGAYIEDVTSYEPNAYPQDGESGDYWYVFEGETPSDPPVPEMARIELSVRLVSDLGTSEWLPMGTYWIDRRDYDKDTGELTLRCVDGMMFGEQDFYPAGSEITDWTNKTMRQVAQMCATKMGIPLEDDTQFQNDTPYVLTAPPIGYSVRQVLAGIAAAHGGNIIVTAENELRLVPFVPVDSGARIWQNAASVETGKQYKLFGNVVFTFDSASGEKLSVRYPLTEAVGATMEAPLLTVTDSGYASTIAQNVLSALGSYRYAPYKAKDALLDPAMELGDGIAINGIISVIAEADEICDELYSSSIGAESFEEIKNEFIFKPSAERTVERKIAQSSASLRVDIDGIKAMVSGLAAPWEAGHAYSVGDIAEYESKFYRCIVANDDDEFDPDKWTEIDSGVVESILQLAIGKMTLSVSGDGSGSSIALTSGSVRITSEAAFFDTNEAHFSGSLSANKISAGSIDAEVVSVKTAFAVQMLVDNVWTTVGYVGAATGIDASGNTTRGAVLKSVDGDSYVIATNAGVRMQQGDTGLWIAGNAISYRINGGDVTPLGYAVFS